MRILLYIIILALLFFAPVQAADVGKLQPVELVLLDARQGSVCLYTDTGDAGEGETVTQALQIMKKNASRLIYLDTATCLLVTPAAERYIADVAQYLDGDVRICFAYAETDLEEAAKYLQIHRDQPTIKAWKQGKTVPFLGL